MSEPGEGVGPIDREAFLAMPRAALLCAREFDSLSDHIASRAALAVAASGLPPADVRRSPGRCIVQLGPVALTVSWVRARVDTVLDGRLMVIQWSGFIARGVARGPERVPTFDPARVAKVLSESTFTADATSERDWHWRNETTPQRRYRSADLADHCVLALRESLGRAAVGHAAPGGE